MRMSTILPCPALRPFVHVFTIVETEHEVVRTLVPTPSIIVGFRYRGESTDLSTAEGALPSAAVTGLRTKARKMKTSSGGGIVLASLKEGEADRFFRMPVDRFFGSTWALESRAPTQSVQEAQRAVIEAPDTVARVRAFERFLVLQMRPRARDRLVAAAVSAICEANGTIRIGELATSLGLSPDRLEKRFRNRVGSSPKQFASIVRLRRAVDEYRPGENLASLAADAGYADLSHLSRQIRATVGSSPGGFFKSGEYC